jgi:GxxExxY protein
MAVPQLSAAQLNRTTSAIIAAAIEVHRILGPGLLESAYATCLRVELQNIGFQCRTDVSVPLVYKGTRIACAYEADIVVNDCVILEVKAVDRVHPIHERQLLTYLRLMNCRVGLVLNFGEATLRSGIRRVVNGFPANANAEGPS